MILSTHGYRIAGVGKVSRNLFSLRDFISYLYILISSVCALILVFACVLDRNCYSRCCKAANNNQKEFVLVMIISLDLLTTTGVHFEGKAGEVARHRN